MSSRLLALLENTVLMDSYSREYCINGWVSSRSPAPLENSVLMDKWVVDY